MRVRRCAGTARRFGRAGAEKWVRPGTTADRQEDRMPVTRVGLIGAGGVAARHARVLSGLPNTQLMGVTDVVPRAAEDLAGTYGARTFPDVAALLDAGPDAVYVCVPPF